MAGIHTTPRHGLRARIAAFAIVITMTASPAWAVTAGDVLDRMTERERFGYITGAIDMAMFLAAVREQNDAKSECIVHWYYSQNAPGPKQVIDIFRQFRDKPAVALINVLIDRRCGSR